MQETTIRHEVSLDVDMEEITDTYYLSVHD